jgi:GNAT superfamily N-acetyltransferase
MVSDLSSPHGGERRIGGYEIVRYAPEDKRGVLELQTHLWGPDRAINAAYFEWKYDRNPYVDAPIIHLARHGGQVVGMLGMYGARWEVGPLRETFIGPCAGDLVVAPGHRGDGTAARLVRRATDDLLDGDVAHAFCLSAALASQYLLMLAGWRSLGPVEQAVWQSGEGSDRGDPRKVHRPADTPRSPFDSLDENYARGPRVTGSHVTIEPAPRPDRMADLVEEIGHDGRLRQVRDAEYFAWRYRNPLSRYRFLFWADTRLEGYLVLQTPVLRAGRTVTIVDWEAVHAGAHAGLLGAALDWGRFEEVAIWTAALSAEAKAILREAGFRTVVPPVTLGRAHRRRASRQVILLTTRPNGPVADWAVGGRRLLDPANWDVRAIDSDNF